MRAVHVDDALDEESAFYPQLTHPLVDRLPPDQTILHLASHYEAGSQLVGCAAALVECGVGSPTRSYLLSLPAKLQSVSFSCVGRFRLLRVFLLICFFVIKKDFD